jgi:TP901 family phage tail tape measure protein
MSLKIDRLQLEVIINNDQARKSLRTLEDESRQLTKDMAKLDKTSKEYADGASRLKSIKQQMDNIYQSIGITGLTMKELINKQRELNNVMRNLDPRLPEYKQLQEQYKAVGDRINELKGKAKDTGLSIGKIADGFNKYFAFVTAGLASLTGLIFSLRKVVDVANLFEKRVDNLSALTGLLGKDLSWLSEEAKKLSTSVIEGNIRITSSATEIVDAYTKVGSKRPELLKVKEDLNSVTKEAMILAAAANGDLQPAVDGLTMVLNQFNAPASESRRIINVLAAGSKEGAGEIDYLTAGFEKAGSVASSFGISVEELTGVLETLAPRISEPEIAGRSLRNIMIKLETQTNNNLKPSIVGLSKAFEYLYEKQWSVTQLNDLFGTENINAANILMNNTAETKKYTQAVTGTSVALEQAAINTDNNTSKLDQAKNRVEVLSIEFGQKLAPAMTFSTNIFAKFMRLVMDAPGFVRQYNIALIALATALLAYNASLVKSIGLKIMNHLLLKEGIGLKFKDAIVTQTQAAREELLTIWKGKGTIATKLAAIAQVAWNAAMALSPLTWIIAGIGALVVAIKAYDKYSAESVRLEKEKTDAINQLASSNTLLTQTYDKQAEKIALLNKLSAEQKKALLAETEATLNQADAQLLLAKAKQETILKENTKTTLWQKVTNAMLSTTNPAAGAAKSATDALINGVKAAAELNDGISELQDNVKRLRSQKSDLNEIVNAEKQADEITGNTISQLEEKQRYLQSALKNYEKGSVDYIRINKKLTEVNKQLQDDTVSGSHSL